MLSFSHPSSHTSMWDAWSLAQGVPLEAASASPSQGGGRGGEGEGGEGVSGVVQVATKRDVLFAGKQPSLAAVGCVMAVSMRPLWGK